MAWFIPTTIVLSTIAAMEVAAALTHRFIMHGFGWGWHRSHHEKRAGLFEKNDLYALVFAGISLALFVAGKAIPALWWVGLGVAAYGALYALLHDGLVHRRIPVGKAPRNMYLKRLIQAHRLHHATHGREGAVSYGFLYAPPVRRLLAQLEAKRARP